MRITALLLMIFMFSAAIVAGCREVKPASVAGRPQKSPSERDESKTSQYFNSESSQRLLRPEELKGLTPFQLKIMKNEIFARHGFIFTDSDMAAYFSGQTWYVPSPDFTAQKLTQAERENIALIERQEGIRTEEPHTGTQAPQNARETVGLWAIKVASAEGLEVYGTKSTKLDVDGDGDLDIIGISAFGGGGSGYHQYIVLFENREGILHYVAMGDAGANGVWTVDRVRLAKRGRIVCSTDVWGKDDPNCCPTTKGTATYSIVGDRLVLE